MPHPAVAQRNTLIAKHNWKLLQVFDTNEHEPDKDVVLVEVGGVSQVLRVGEYRRPGFFYEGFIGQYFVVPKILFTDTAVPYELEEYIPGTMLDSMYTPANPDMMLPEYVINLSIQAFWESQIVFSKQLQLEKSWDFEKTIQKYYATVEKTLNIEQQNFFTHIFTDLQFKSFWSDMYPSKWKFSPDNLLITPDDKIAFLDNARAGLRYWGYDLGMFLWSMWFCFDDETLHKTDEYFDFLDVFLEKLWHYKPDEISLTQAELEKRFWMVVCLWSLGALYDIEAKISHTERVYKEGSIPALKNFVEAVMHRSFGELELSIKY